MWLCNHDHPANPERLEMMEIRGDDRGIADAWAIQEIFLNILRGIELLETAVVELSDVMFTQEQVGVHPIVDSNKLSKSSWSLVILVGS